MFVVLTSKPQFVQYVCNKSRLVCRSSGVLARIAMSSANNKSIRTISSIFKLHSILSCRNISRSSIHSENNKRDVTSPCLRPTAYWKYYEYELHCFTHDFTLLYMSLMVLRNFPCMPARCYLNHNPLR